MPQAKIKAGYGFNLQTNRYCKIGSPAHNKATVEGTLRIDPDPEPESEPEPEPEPEPKPNNSNGFNGSNGSNGFDEKKLKMLIQSELIKISTDKKNLKKLKNQTQANQETALRKLLFDKLNLANSKKAKKTKKKTRFKIAKPQAPPPSPSSSESELSD